jgi:PPM family protein phosphatase
MLEIEACVLSHVGKVRTENEDCASFVRPSDKGPLATHGMLAVLADGMGGHEAGELASQLAVEWVTRSYYSAKARPPEALKRALLDANREIYRTARAEPALKGMGTTCVAAAVCGDQAWWAWIGDSRLYLLRAGRIERLSEDHTLVQDMVRRGLMTAEEARCHSDRNVLERAMGTREEVEVGMGKRPIALAAGYRLLLCSDGLHDLIGDEELGKRGGEGSVADSAQTLLDLALDRGGHDNISVVLVEARAESALPKRTPATTREHILA